MGAAPVEEEVKGNRKDQKIGDVVVAATDTDKEVKGRKGDNINRMKATNTEDATRGKKAVKETVEGDVVVENEVLVGAPNEVAAEEPAAKSIKEAKTAKADANLKVEAAAGEEPAAKSIKQPKTAKVAATQDEPVKSRRVGGKQATTET